MEEDKINTMIKKGRTVLIIVQAQDNSVNSTLCNEIMGQVCKHGTRKLFTVKFEDIVKLDPICHVLKSPGVIVLKEKIVLKCLTAAEVVTLDVNGVQNLIGRLERNYANTKSGEKGVDSYFGHKMEPFNMREESLKGEFEKTPTAARNQDELLADEDVYPRPTDEPKLMAGNNVIDVKCTLSHLALLLLPGETVVQALKRLKAGVNAQEQKEFNEITEDSTLLAMNGYPGIYAESKESIELKLPVGGFVWGWDPETGYYYDADSGWYYDPESGYYAWGGVWYRC